MSGLQHLVGAWSLVPGPLPWPKRAKQAMPCWTWTVSASWAKERSHDLLLRWRAWVTWLHVAAGTGPWNQQELFEVLVMWPRACSKINGQWVSCWFGTCLYIFICSYVGNVIIPKTIPQSSHHHSWYVHSPLPGKWVVCYSHTCIRYLRHSQTVL